MSSATGRVLSVGSINADVTFRVHDLVRAGETLRALKSNVTSGGNSANQAVAARLGSNTALIAAVGTLVWRTDSSRG